MKKTLIPLLVVVMAVGPWAGASPTPPPLELWVMDADGTNQRHLVEDDNTYALFYGFSWSPDSSRIAVSGLAIVDVSTGTAVEAGSGRDPDWSIKDEIVFVDEGPSGSNALYVMDGAGQSRRLLLEIGASGPSWSPDGDQVAFVAGSGSGEAAQVFVVDSDGSDVRQLTTAGSKYKSPVWSPDGRTIAFETFESQVYLVDVDGTDERPVAGFEYASHPTWCPDGTLYFTGQNQNEVAHIHGLSPAGELTRVAEGASSDCGPDGRIAFSRRGDVYVVIPGTPGEPNLTSSEDRTDFDVSWSPDGSRMAFVSYQDVPGPTPVSRTISTRLRDHLAIRGRIDPAPHQHSCQDVVKVQRIGEEGWRRVDFASVSEDGRFRAELPDRAGLYRVLSPRHAGGFGTFDCLRAVSEIVRHRH